jgi:hypothetical protein
MRQPFWNWIPAFAGMTDEILTIEELEILAENEAREASRGSVLLMYVTDCEPDRNEVIGQKINFGDMK